MLDRSKLAQELQRVAGSLFVDASPVIEQARAAWDLIAHDPQVADRVSGISAPVSIPSWQGILGERINLAPLLDTVTSQYHVLSVDGSQIYPDRHYGPSCFLINIGSIAMYYGSKSRVQLYSQPRIFSAHDELGLALSTDLVNCRRQALEFSEGLAQGVQIKQEIGSTPFVLLFDGSLIFWLLESKEDQLRDTFLQEYLVSLHAMYHARLPMAGYISLPKSKELVNIARMAAVEYDKNRLEEQLFEHIFDSTIAEFFLKPYERTIVFRNNAPISAHYPDHLRPHFFYLHVGAEIGRIEIPAWIASNRELVDSIAAIIIDQCKKGYGYPIAIAEAHEQAVVKGPDREFFYQLLDKVSLDRARQAQHGSKSGLAISQKSMRKRSIGF